MENKRAKRFYKVKEIVWIIDLKTDGVVESIDKKDLSMTVSYVDEKGINQTFKGKMWNFDKIKYSRKEKLVKSGKISTSNNTNNKITYFASVNGGIIPTKEEENAGRDCYARLEPINRNGELIYELHIPKLTLAKIPLGFASYLDKNDLLSLKHERSSIGGVGLINLSGLIDSTYQGEVILQVVPLIADVVITSQVNEKIYDEVTNTYFIPYSKAVAQAVILEQSKAKDTHISYDELLNKPSTRGVGGWGSTNK